MSWEAVFPQQLINGLSLGAMYALLALGFTLVYGILELINFAHFNVFMVSSFIAMAVLGLFGIVGQSHVLTGLALVGVLAFAFVVTMVAAGGIGVLIERFALRPLRGVPGTVGMITTIGVSYILFNIILLRVGTGSFNFPNPMPRIAWPIGGAVLELRELLIWGVALVLMLGLHLFVNKTRLGKAMRAAALIFGLYYNSSSFIIGYTAGLRAFPAAVLGGIGSVTGAMVGGIIIGLIEALGGQLIAVRWTGVIIFSILVLVLVFAPTGLMGRANPTKS